MMIRYIRYNQEVIYPRTVWWDDQVGGGIKEDTKGPVIGRRSAENEEFC
jgi:hypothetical protein